MEKKISVGIQLFEDVIQDDTFYVDKTKFIEDWWNEKVRVSLITRPGRFGKTLSIPPFQRFADRRAITDLLHSETQKHPGRKAARHGKRAARPEGRSRHRVVT